MQVILMHPVKKLGKIGDEVTVKSGFARNYLIPNKFAIRATQDNLQLINDQKHILEEKSNELFSKAETIAKSIEGKDLVFVKQTSDDGRLYGSLTAKEVAAKLFEITNHSVNGTQILLTAPIKNIGFYSCIVNLHPDVSTSINIAIGRTESEAKDLLRSSKQPETQPEPEANI